MSEALKRVFPLRIISRRWDGSGEAPCEINVLMDNGHVYRFTLDIRQPSPHIFHQREPIRMPVYGGYKAEPEYRGKHAKK